MRGGCFGRVLTACCQATSWVWTRTSRSFLLCPAQLPYGSRTRIHINRPPTGGDLTFSWKEGHICTVVLLEVSSLATAVS